MEKFVMGGAGPLLMVAGLVAVVAVGIMSILLSILVFRLLSEVSKMNEKMSKVITALNEVAKAARAMPAQRQAEERDPEPFESRKNRTMGFGEQSIRFK